MSIHVSLDNVLAGGLIPIRYIYGICKQAKKKLN